MRLLFLILPALFIGTSPAFADDAANVTLLGRWAEGPCLAMEAADGIAYFGNGAILEIVDFSSPNGNVLLSRVPLPGPILGVGMAGGLAGVANGSAGLRVIDISDPSLAYQSGFYQSPGCVEEVAIDDTHAYLAAGEAGLRVVDISDPTAPVETGFLDTPGYADDIVLAGGVAYLGDGTSLRIIDVANPAGPMEIGFHPTASAYEEIVGLDVAGNLAYLVTQRISGGGTKGLRVIDVSDPAAPVEIGFLDTFNEAYDVSVSGDHAFVAARTAGLRVIDVSDPANMVEVGFANPDEWIYGVEIHDQTAYLATWWDGLVLMDVTVPASPARINRHDTRGISDLVTAAGDMAYLNLFGERLHFLDVSSPDTPIIAGVFSPSIPALGILLDGSYAYVLAGYPDLRVFDMADPGAPVEVGVLEIMGTFVALDIAISGDFAFFPMVGGHSSCGMQIVDISDPTSPFQLAYLETSLPRCVAAGDGFAYLGDYSALWVVDATDPENPLVAGTLATPGLVEDVVLQDDLVYFVGSDAGLRIVNVSDPYAPNEVGHCETPGQALGIFVWDQYAYVADGTAGLRAVRAPLPRTGGGLRAVGHDVRPAAGGAGEARSRPEPLTPSLSPRRGSGNRTSNVANSNYRVCPRAATSLRDAV